MSPRYGAIGAIRRIAAAAAAAAAVADKHDDDEEDDELDDEEEELDDDDDDALLPMPRRLAAATKSIGGIGGPTAPRRSGEATAPLAPAPAPAPAYGCGTPAPAPAKCFRFACFGSGGRIGRAGEQWNVCTHAAATCSGVSWLRLKRVQAGRVGGAGVGCTAVGGCGLRWAGEAPPNSDDPDIPLA